MGLTPHQQDIIDNGYHVLTATDMSGYLAALREPEPTIDTHEILDDLTEEERRLADEMSSVCPECQGAGGYQDVDVDEYLYHTEGILSGHEIFIDCPICLGTGQL